MSYSPTNWNGSFRFHNKTLKAFVCIGSTQYGWWEDLNDGRLAFCSSKGSAECSWFAKRKTLTSLKLQRADIRLDSRPEPVIRRQSPFKLPEKGLLGTCYLIESLIEPIIPFNFLHCLLSHHVKLLGLRGYSKLSPPFDLACYHHPLIAWLEVVAWGSSSSSALTGGGMLTPTLG